MNPNSPDYGKHLLVRGVYYSAPIKRADIGAFVDNLHAIQLEYLDEAVMKSDMSESKAVIKHIMEKK